MSLASPSHKQTLHSRSVKSYEMPEPSTQHGRSFDENIGILFDELVLASKWGRPSVLLAVHKSKFGQEKAEKALETRLNQQGQEVVHVMVNNQRSDIANLITSAGPAVGTVFFISNIGWGGGEDGKQSYRSLNMQRELFVDARIRAVFWLTTHEAADLPRYAPDFWAFRHRVVEFVSQRARGRVRVPVGVLSWDVQKSVDPFDSLQDGIRAREELLRKLPHNLEALSTRIELHQGLGYLHWLGGDSQRSAQALKAGLELGRDYELPELKTRLLNGLGIIHYESGEYSEALSQFTEGLAHQPANSALLTNMAAAYCMLGRNQDAISSCERAMRLNPTDADCWSRSGYIYAAMGKPDEAISRLAKAVELDPHRAAYHVSLAVFYSIVERPDESKRELGLAGQVAGQEGAAYRAILEEAMLGDAGKADRLLMAATDRGQLTKHGIRRDPNLAILFEAGRVEALGA
jgi:tetratricopeptide (TPR) repeat protein